MELSEFLSYSTIVLFLSGYFRVLLPPTMADASVGINYGQIANNLPPPEKVVALVQSIGATKVKLYDADALVLRAFANTTVEFVIGIGNEYLSAMKDPNKALAWVKTNVNPHLPSTKITSIFVGNEVFSFNDTSLIENLVPAMESVHTALVNLGLDKQVSVTTAHSLAILETSYPPSAGAFRRDLTESLVPILKFLGKTGSPFMINAYPFFSYKSNPKQVPLDFVLFRPNRGITDPNTNLHYENMLFSQIDAVYSALSLLGFKNLAVQISETGWPSKGDEDEPGATLDNAESYNANLMKLIIEKKKKGTPLRPNADLNIFVFALFNENLKPGPTSERNYGLFRPDGSPAYRLEHSKNEEHGNDRSVGDDIASTGEQPSPASSATTTTTVGYLSISSSARMAQHQAVGAWLVVVVVVMLHHRLGFGRSSF